LGQRYEQLGYTFDRRQLDDIYRRFIVLADKVKRVEDSHLRELAKDAGAAKTDPSSSNSGGRESFQKPFPASIPAAETARVAGHEHHGEQEDYLWGV
jgi:isopropylmalate/homocitrate/citramalate synthase